MILRKDMITMITVIDDITISHEKENARSG
jgi:hypothetical protein